MYISFINRFCVVYTDFVPSGLIVFTFGIKQLVFFTKTEFEKL